MARTFRYEPDPFELPPRHHGSAPDGPASSWDDDDNEDNDDWDDDNTDGASFDDSGWDDSDDTESWDYRGQHGTEH